MPFNLADLLEAVTDAVPDRPALVAGDARLTYGELDTRANRLAHVLADAGVGPGDHVAVYAQNSVEWVETLIGCLKLRAVPVNVNFRYLAGELAYLFENARPAALVVEDRYLERALATPASAALRTVLVVGGDGPLPAGVRRYADAVAGADPGRPAGPRSGDDRYLIYTGGTTGMPKGVCWRHEDLFFAGLARPGPTGALPATPEDVLAHTAHPPLVYLTVAPLMHGAAQLGVLIGLTTAGTVALWTGRTFDPGAIWQLAAAERAVSLTVVGDAMARPLVDRLAAERDRYDLSGLFAVASAGAILTDGVREALRSLLPNVLLIDSYGATELGHGGTEAGGRGLFRMAEDTAVLGDDLRPVVVGSGTVGRIARRGHIPIGYHGDAAKTAATFLTDPDGVRWVVPGDLATVRPDGTVELLGRGSTVVNTGGEKVFPEEVENALAAHPAVADVIVVGVPDERYGERVVALVVAAPGAAPAADELRAYCRERIAGYKTPREVHVVARIARSPAGKADYPWARAEAAALVAAQAPSR